MLGVVVTASNIPSSPHMFGSEKVTAPQELRELVGVKASKASKGRVQVNMLGFVAIWGVLKMVDPIKKHRFQYENGRQWLG